MLEKGRVLEAGSHEELVALDGQYAKLFARQARAFLAPPDDVRTSGTHAAHGDTGAEKRRV
jgi:ATP-binding cassette subfamily B protein